VLHLSSVGPDPELLNRYIYQINFSLKGNESYVRRMSCLDAEKWNSVLSLHLKNLFLGHPVVSVALRKSILSYLCKSIFLI
jgi:hypothetical protein